MLFSTRSDGDQNSDSDIDTYIDQKWNDYGNKMKNTDSNVNRMKDVNMIDYRSAGYTEEDSSYNVKNIPLRFDTMATNYASVGINYTVTFLIQKYGESHLIFKYS